MVVDDDAMLQNVVVRILDRAGFSVATANDGDECIDALRRGFRGVLLLDYAMPRLDGPSTLQVMASEGLIDGVTVCMLTGLEEPSARLETLGSMVVNYVRKPFEPEDLVAVVQDAAELADDLDNCLWLP